MTEETTTTETIEANDGESTTPGRVRANKEDIAHDVHRDYPKLGTKADIRELVDRVFDIILERTANGEEVTLRGFGTFSADMFKGRSLTSPLMKGGSITFADQLVLRFRQSQSAKQTINRIASEPATVKRAKAEAKKAAKKAAEPAPAPTPAAAPEPAPATPPATPAAAPAAPAAAKKSKKGGTRPVPPAPPAKE